ncbi:MAG: hypothetical protein WCV63_09325 [Negativicutes bacterium]|jgi:hypothetical protein
MYNKITLVALFAIIAFTFSGCYQQPDINNQNTQTQLAVNQLQQSHELLVMPQNGKQPLINLINSAKKSVDIIIYEFEDDKRLISVTHW